MNEKDEFFNNRRIKKQVAVRQIIIGCTFLVFLSLTLTFLFLYALPRGFSIAMIAFDTALTLASMFFLLMAMLSLDEPAIQDAFEEWFD